MKRFILILIFCLSAAASFAQEIPQLQLRPESEVSAMTAQQQYEYYSGLAGQCHRLRHECESLVTSCQMRADSYHRRAGEKHLMYDHFRQNHMDSTAQEFYDEYKALNDSSRYWQTLCDKAKRQARIYSELKISYADRAASISMNLKSEK